MALMEIRNEKEESIRSALSTEIVKLSFRKIKTNETRHMRVTLCDEYVPMTDNIKEQRKEPSGLITAWSLDAKEWRRFYADRVDEWEVEKRVDVFA
jgi:hypothetical protein